MSPKLRKLAAEIGIRMRRRTCVVQDTPAKAATAFSSAEKAKDTAWVIGNAAANRTMAAARCEEICISMAYDVMSITDFY
ncbi:MAG: hypothetical protein HWE35_22640 [Rhodobacteraceae bacterium]|nr:hypothetical protein [Paracoccaceae bacterium]